MSGKRGGPDGNKQIAAVTCLWSSVIEPEIDFGRALIVLQATAVAAQLQPSLARPVTRRLVGEKMRFRLKFGRCLIRLQDRWIYTGVCDGSPNF